MKGKIIALIIFFLGCFFFCLYIMHLCYVSSMVGFLNIQNGDVIKSLINNPLIVYGVLETNKAVFIGFILSFCMCAIFFLVIVSSIFNNKNYTYRDKEYGSAKFATIKEMQILKDKNYENNRILSENTLLSMNGSVSKRNNNVCVFGGAGARKTTGIVYPNIMQLNSSYIISDPKGEILRTTGKMLKDADYEIRVLDLTNVKNSDYYNPFSYINEDKEQDIITLIDFIMNNTNNGQKSKDPFWDGAEKMLITAMFFYIIKEGGENEKNIDTMMYLINKIDLNKKEDEIDIIDILFDDFARKYGEDHIAVRNYISFRQGGAKNQGSILLTNSARLNLFNLEDLRNLTNRDSLNLKTIGDEERVALFITITPTDKSLNFLAGLMYTQLFKILDHKANIEYGGSLPTPVTFLLDEFANIGKIPNFPEILSYARGLNVGIVPILQSFSQLKKMYKDEYESIIDNCDTTVFLGGQGLDNLKYFSERLGKATIDMTNQNKSFGHSRSVSLNESKTGRNLLTPDEVGTMDINKCIVFIRNVNPFIDNKYNFKKHKNFKLLGADDKNNQYVHKRKESENNVKLDKVYDDATEEEQEMVNNVEQEIEDMSISDASEYLD